MTVKRPLSPHAQAMAPRGCLAIDRIPNGNGIPRKKPKGKIINTVIEIRIGVGEVRNQLKTTECVINTIIPLNKMPINGHVQRLFMLILSLRELRLPIAAESSMAKTTVE